MSVGYIKGNMNTSDGLTKAKSSANLRSLLNGNSFRSVTEFKRRGLGKDYMQRNAILFSPERFMVESIWIKTCDERRARGEVHIGKQL